MRKMKKISALILSLILLFSMTACKKAIIEESYYSDYIDTSAIESEVQSDTGEDDTTDSSKDDKTSSSEKTNSTNKNNGILKNDKTSSQQDSTASKNEGTNSKDNGLNYNPNTNAAFNPYKGIEAYKGKTVKVLSWWNLSNDEKKRIDTFTSKYGINIKLIKTDWANYQSKLAGLITSGSSPDLCSLSAEYFPMAVIKNRVQPIDTSFWNLKEDTALDKKLMEQFSWDGKYYGVNIKGSMFGERAVIFYNKSLFQNKGIKTPYDEYIAGNWNWDTFANAAKKLSDSEKGVYGFGDRSYNAINWLLSNDTDLVLLNDSKIKNNLTAQKVKTSFGFISDLIASGCVKTEATSDDFLSGKIAMFALGSSSMWKTGTIATTMKSAWGVAPFPSPKGQKSIVANDGSMWAFPVNAKNVGAANYFIRYFLDPSNAEENPCANDECTRVFNDISHTENIRTCFSKGLISFNNADDFYAILRCRLKGKNDIPVYLQSYVKTVDESIKSAVNELSGG